MFFNKSMNYVKNIVLLLLFSFLSYNTYAQSWYTLQDDDVVVENGVIISCSYDFSITNIIIPSTLDGQKITEISEYYGEGAFKNKGITNLQLPKTVKWINSESFEDNLLKKVIIPDSVIAIQNYAFHNNTIDTLILPNSLQIIGQGVFRNNSIDSLFIPKNVRAIGLYAFKNNSIGKLIFESNSKLEEICGDAFSNNLLMELDIPDNVFHIGGYSFESNQISSLEIPDSITILGGGAFNGNKIAFVNGKAFNGFFYARKKDGKQDSTILVSYGGNNKYMNYIPENVIYLSWGAFYNCSLDSVIIPRNIVKIGGAAFSKNPLKKVYFEENSSIRMILEYSFNNDIDSTFFILPTNSNSEFSRYKDQYNNYFNPGDTITEISNACLADLGFYTLKIDDVDFTEGKINRYTGHIKGYSDIIIPDSFNGIPVTSIEDNSFNGMSLDSVILPNSIEYVGNFAFANNIITSINLPTPILKEGYDSFNGWYEENTDTLINSIINNFFTSYIAKFTLTIYDINYINVGTLNSPLNPFTYTINDEIRLWGPSDSTDRVFAGWFRDEFFKDEIGIPFIIAGSTGDINVYAKWIQLNTGINRNSKISFKLYPNPADRLLNINIDCSTSNNAVVELYSITGNLILQEILYKKNHVIKLDNLNNGLYIVKLKVGKNEISKKIIVHK